MTEESQYSLPSDSNRDNEWIKLLNQMLKDKILNTEQFKYFHDELSRYIHDGPILPDEELLQPSPGRRKQQLHDLSPTQFTGSQNIRFIPFGQPLNWISHEKAWANLIDNWTNIYNRLSKFFLRHPGDILKDFYDCPLYRTRKWGKKFWQHFKDGFRENTSQSHPITHEFSFGDVWQESTIKEQIDQVKIKIRRYKVKYEGSGKTSFHLHDDGTLYAIDHDHDQGNLKVKHDHDKGDLHVNHNHRLTGATISKELAATDYNSADQQDININASNKIIAQINNTSTSKVIMFVHLEIKNYLGAQKWFKVYIRYKNYLGNWVCEPNCTGQKKYLHHGGWGSWFFMISVYPNSAVYCKANVETLGVCGIAFESGIIGPHNHDLDLDTNDEDATLTGGDCGENDATLTGGVTGDEDAVCEGNTGQTEADIDQAIYEIDDGASYPIIVKLNGNIIHTIASLAVGENEIVDITEAVRNLADPSSFNLEVYPDHANAVVRLDTNLSAKMWWRQHQIPGVTPGMNFIWGPPRS